MIDQQKPTETPKASLESLSPSPDLETPTNGELRFDDILVSRYRALTEACIAAFPELRSAITVFDYHGNYNETDAQGAVWTVKKGAHGVPDFAAVVGTARQMFAAQEGLLRSLEATKLELDNEVVEKAKQLRDLEIKIAEARKEVET